MVGAEVLASVTFNINNMFSLSSSALSFSVCSFFLRQVRPEHLRKALEERVAGRLKTRRFTFSMGQASPPAT